MSDNVRPVAGDWQCDLLPCANGASVNGNDVPATDSSRSSLTNSLLCLAVGQSTGFGRLFAKPW